VATAPVPLMSCESAYAPPPFTLHSGPQLSIPMPHHPAWLRVNEVKTPMM